MIPLLVRLNYNYKVRRTFLSRNPPGRPPDMAILLPVHTIRCMEDRNCPVWGPELWEELRSKDPRGVRERCGLEKADAGYYSFRSLGRMVRIDPGEERVESEDASLAESGDFRLTAVTYLLNAQNIEPTGIWVSEKDLKGGSLFFRGPHGLPSAPLEKRFGQDPEGFREAALELGGQPVGFGDAAASFPVLPRVPLAVVLWAGDEEFPPRVTFMLDSSVEVHLPLDVICAMTRAVTERLLEAGQSL